MTRLTTRCLDLLRLLRVARWLSTRQIHRRFFSGATLDAARRRLRKLTEAGYLAMVQEHPMREHLFTLGREGKRVFEKDGSNEIVLEHRLPKQLDHFLGVNDLRIAAELDGELSYFFASWELPSLGWHYSVIPDAVLRLEGRTYAAEFDRGLESLQYFIRTKIEVYLRGLHGFPFTALLVIASGGARMRSLFKALSSSSFRILFSTLDSIQERGLSAPVFYQNPEGRPTTLICGSLPKVSCRQETFFLASPSKEGGFEKSAPPS